MDNTNAFLTLLESWVRRWEGKRNAVYLDSKGIPTIGVGCNLLTSAAKDGLYTLGLDYNKVLAGTLTLTDAQINSLLDHALGYALEGARSIVKNFDDLPRNQKLVVADLSYNMGAPTFAKFHNTINFIEAGDWVGAAENLKLSAWFHQVGSGAHQRGGANVAVLAGATQPEIYI
jgi:lysozyme